MTSIKLLPTINSMFSGLLVLSLWGSCNTPVETIIAEPGRRDYEWTFDTLWGSSSDQQVFAQLWGSSPTDVWVTNYTRSRFPAWHFDGTKWSPDTSLTRMEWYGIWGFASNNVWACEGGPTSGSRVWQYNGTSWQQKTTLVPEGNYIIIQGCWGDQPDRFYLVGATGDLDGSSYQGIVFQSDGTTFLRLPIVDQSVMFQTIRKDVLGTGRLYLYGIPIGGLADSAWFFELADNRLRKLKKVARPAYVDEVGGNVYFNFEKKIYRFDGIKFEMVVDLSGTEFLGRLWGRSIRDFFSVAASGLGHYNGTDYKVLVPTSQFITDVAVFENEVFVILGDDDFTRTVIMHGVLKGG